MPRLIDRLRPPRAEARFSLDDLAHQIEWLTYQGHQYLVGGGRVGSYRQEEVRVTSEGGAYASSGVVFAVVGRRMDLYSQVEFAWRRPGAGPRPMASDLFRDDALVPLDEPADLLAWMELDQALAGNSFVVRDGAELRRLVPWWVLIVLGSERYPDHPEVAWDAKPIGYLYQPPGCDPEVFLPGEVAHYYNRPDPDARWRGMSYLRPVLRNVANTEGYERYIQQFWRNAATPSLLFKFPPEKTNSEINKYMDLWDEGHRGVANAWKSAGIGGGADPVVVGSKLSDLAAKEVSASEFGQICAAAAVPPVVVTMVPGLEATATFNNYAAALRSFADLTVRPLWRKTVRAVAPLIGPPLRGGEGRLWYDPSGISALQEDAKDDAEVAFLEAQTMRQLIEGGYEPDSVTLAVTTGDRSKLRHTGLVSVQLQPPGGADVGDEDGDGPEPDPSGESAPSVDAAARILQQLTAPAREGLLSEDEAREMANRAGAGLVGPAPEKPDPPPAQPAPFSQLPAVVDDPDDEPEEDEAA